MTFYIKERIENASRPRRFDDRAKSENRKAVPGHGDGGGEAVGRGKCEQT